MNEHDPLTQLADLMGIVPSYWDIFGGYHETAEETKRVLLQAMGYDVSTKDATLESLKRTDRRRWGRLVRPVRVLRANGPPLTVPLYVPREKMTCEIRWRLLQEDGAEYAGRFLPEQSQPSASHNLDDTEIYEVPFELPVNPPAGYHRFDVSIGETKQSCKLIVAPPAAYRPPWTQTEETQTEERKWGWACALYALRSDRNWGIGDYSDLGRFAAAALGADTIGINPLHSLFLQKPEDASPYSPSSRIFLNPLYIDVAAAESYLQGNAVQHLCASDKISSAVRTARDTSHVDYDAVAKIKISALEVLFAEFTKRHPPGPTESPQRQAFTSFIREGNATLNRFALFEAVQEHFDKQPWPQWPPGFERPESPAAKQFAQDNRERIEFHAFLQWIGNRQLGAAAKRCKEAGMAIGLYRDLAVGLNPNGGDVWSDQDAYALNARIGAPPDALNNEGQDWGLPPFLPDELRDRAYEPFIKMLQANMQFAGALRIDHVMGLQRLFWLVPGETKTPGAYVTYPLDDLLGILALESQRNRCMIIGEDLGTVPDGFRERMDAEGILSYRVLFFERYQDGLYKRPDQYPRHSMSISSTHDMPTIHGYWGGHDVLQRRDIGMLKTNDDVLNAAAERDHEKKLLTAALQDQALLQTSPTGQDDQTLPHHLVPAIQRFLARTPSLLMLANIDDALLENDQLNIPGTVFEYPNWRRKLSVPVEKFSTDPRVKDVAKAISSERPPVNPEAVSGPK